jgi:hypothetical protein
VSISRKYLQRIIKEEIHKLLEEEESPRGAHLKGSQFAGAGKFIGRGGQAAYRKEQCKKSWKIHGQWVQGMGDCAELLARAEETQVTPSGDSASNWQATTEERLDTIERRLTAAGIN